MILLKKYYLATPLPTQTSTTANFLPTAWNQHDKIIMTLSPCRLNSSSDIFCFLFDQINMTACNHYFPVELQS